MKSFLVTASLISLTISLAGGWFELYGVLSIGFLAFAALIFIAHLDQISEFKASSSGIEAKTREVLNKAENTVSELESLAKIFAESTLTSIKKSGRFGGFSDEDEEKFKREILHVLEEVGVEEAEQEKILSEWHKLTEYDYACYILGATTIPQGFNDHSVIDEWKKLRDFDDIPSPQRVEEFLDKLGVLTDDRKEYLEDYKYYVSNRAHRRPEIWKNRTKWGNLEKP